MRKAKKDKSAIAELKQMIVLMTALQQMLQLPNTADFAIVKAKMVTAKLKSIRQHAVRRNQQTMLTQCQ